MKKTFTLDLLEILSKRLYMHRAIIFTDQPYGAPGILIEAALRALASREDIEIAAVSIPERHRRDGTLRSHLSRKLPLAIDPALLQAPACRNPLRRAPDLGRLAQAYRFALISPPDGRINDMQFVERLRRDFKPTIALSFYAQQKFGEPLLGIFQHAVNYHNGLLPGYRGLKATAWSIYHEEAQSGFTFHRMNRAIDEGPVLLEGALPVLPDTNAVDLDQDKASAAAALLPRLLQTIVDNEPGRPQGGAARYFSKRHWEELTRVHNPSTLTSEELARRLRAFESLRLNVNGRWHRVTRLRRGAAPCGGAPPHSFRSADDIVFTPVKSRRVPLALWWVIMWGFGRLPNGKPRSDHLQPQVEVSNES